MDVWNIASVAADSLTEYGDVDASGVVLALNDIQNVANIVSTLGHGGAGEEVAGACLHGEEVICQRLHVDHLEGGQIEVVSQNGGKKSWNEFGAV